MYNHKLGAGLSKLSWISFIFYWKFQTKENFVFIHLIKFSVTLFGIFVEHIFRNLSFHPPLQYLTSPHNPPSLQRIRVQWSWWEVVNDPSVPQWVFTITEKDPTRAFSWLKAPTSAFTFKTLLRHGLNGHWPHGK